MNAQPHAIVLATVVILMLLSAGAITWAQTSAGFDLRWHVVGSSDHSSSADFRVSGTVGQNMTSPSTASSAAFNMTGGFWVDAPVVTEEPTGAPTDAPTGEPTSEPTNEPTSAPTGEPTAEAEDVRLPYIVR